MCSMLIIYATASPPQFAPKPAASSSIFPSLTSTEPYPSPTSLAHCWKEVTPECLRALYNFTVADPALPVDPSNTMGQVIEVCKPYNPLRRGLTVALSKTQPLRERWRHLFTNRSRPLLPAVRTKYTYRNVADLQQHRRD